MPGDTEISASDSLAVTIVALMATTILLFGNSGAGTLLGLIGALLVALSLLERRERSAVWTRARVALAFSGLILIAAGGWFDFEGWRFAMRGPPGDLP